MCVDWLGLVGIGFVLHRREETRIKNDGFECFLCFGGGE